MWALLTSQCKVSNAQLTYMSCGPLFHYVSHSSIKLRCISRTTVPIKININTERKCNPLWLKKSLHIWSQNFMDMNNEGFASYVYKNKWYCNRRIYVITQLNVKKKKTKQNTYTENRNRNVFWSNTFISISRGWGWSTFNVLGYHGKTTIATQCGGMQSPV